MSVYFLFLGIYGHHFFQVRLLCFGCLPIPNIDTRTCYISISTINNPTELVLNLNKLLGVFNVLSVNNMGTFLIENCVANELIILNIIIIIIDTMQTDMFLHHSLILCKTSNGVM